MFSLVILIGIPVAIGIGIALIWGGYKNLINFQQVVRNTFAQVRNAYQRRFDLVPNLVVAVDSFMSRQETTLEKVINLRRQVVQVSEEASNMLGQATVSALEKVAKEVGKSIGSFVNAVAEAYPEIKGDSLFSDLMAQLNTTEQTIFDQRTTYNAAVKLYNNTRKATIGGLIGGRLFNLPWEEEFFKGEEGIEHAPSVARVFKG